MKVLKILQIIFTPATMDMSEKMNTGIVKGERANKEKSQYFYFL